MVYPAPWGRVRLDAEAPWRYAWAMSQRPIFDRLARSARTLWRLPQPFWRAVQMWLDADGLRMSAAMSFYGLVSLAPLLLLIVVALGWWLGQDQVQASLIAQVSALIGAQGAEMLQGAIVATRAQSSGVFASIVALATLVMGATGVFAELH